MYNTMTKLFIALTILSVIGLSVSTVCRDGSQCPGETTCCLTPRGVGCCPYPNANCCGDGVHCCPNGYQCDVSGNKCNKRAGSNEFLTFLDTTEESSAELTASTPVPELALQGPSITDIIKCVSDLEPVVKDIMTLVKEWKNGNKDAIKDVLIKLTTDGIALGTDCAKVFSQL